MIGIPYLFTVRKFPESLSKNNLEIIKIIYHKYRYIVIIKKKTILLIQTFRKDDTKTFFSFIHDFDEIIILKIPIR